MSSKKKGTKKGKKVKKEVLFITLKKIFLKNYNRKSLHPIFLKPMERISKT